MTWQTTVKHSLFVTLAALAAQQAAASGYHFGTQSVSSQSTANSSAAEAADTSTLFYNGAGLTKLDGTQATVNLNVVVPSVKYENAEGYYPDGTKIENGPDGKQAAKTSGKIAKTTVVPHLYASHKINDQFAVGLGAYVPFGSGTDYDRNSVLRYNLNELGLQTLAIQPTVAFKLNEQHSFGVGLVAQNTKAQLRQYANFGGFVEQGANAAAPALKAAISAEVVKAAQATGQQPTPQFVAQVAQQYLKGAISKLDNDIQALSAGIAQAEKAGADTTKMKAQLAGLKQQAFGVKSYALRAKSGKDNANGLADGYAKVKGDDWGFGYTLGWLWDINDSVRVGANYRSKVKHTLKGHSEWVLSDGLFNGENGAELKAAVRENGYAEKEDASVTIVTPESLSLHGMWKVNPQWNVFGDATWTRHSRFNQANLMLGGNKRVSGPNPVANYSNENVLIPNWKNTWKVSAGASYQYSPALQLRAGLAYDQSPVKNADYRMTTMPDNDRIWLSFGAKYDIAPQHSINAAYSHIFIKNAKANVNGFCGGENAAAVACVSSKTKGSANYKSSADILGLQYTYKF